MLSEGTAIVHKIGAFFSAFSKLFLYVRTLHNVLSPQQKDARTEDKAAFLQLKLHQIMSITRTYD